MVTLTDLLNSHSLAGARFRAAADELRAAFVELAALDATLRNPGINPHGTPVTFEIDPQMLNEIRHPVFGPPDIKTDFKKQIETRRDELERAFFFNGM